MSPKNATPSKTNITIDAEDEEILEQIRKMLSEKEGRISNVAIFRRATRVLLRELRIGEEKK